MKALEVMQNKKRRKKISYSDLAKHLGITKQCFYRHLRVLKTGRNPFSAEQMQKICDFIDEDITIFFD